MKLPKFLSNIERLDVVYALQVILFVGITVISDDKLLIIIYGFLATNIAYQRGKVFSQKKAAKSMEPLLERARDCLEEQKQELAEAERKLEVMKNKLFDYENRL